MLERSTDASFTSPTAIQIPENATLLGHGPGRVDHLLLRLKARNASANPRPLAPPRTPPAYRATTPGGTTTPTTRPDTRRPLSGFTRRPRVRAATATPIASTTYYYRVWAQNATASLATPQPHAGTTPPHSRGSGSGQPGPGGWEASTTAGTAARRPYLTGPLGGASRHRQQGRHLRRRRTITCESPTRWG